jgi:low affinity Fe/Cu permease
MSALALEDIRALNRGAAFGVTSIITFLMVFFIQTSQNRDSTAIQAKLDELIRVTSAKNLFVGLEELSPDEIAEVRRQVHGHLESRRQRT